MSSVLSSLPSPFFLFFPSFFLFFFVSSFHFLTRPRPFFIFSFSLSLPSSISPSEFQREVSGYREYTRAKFLPCTYICIYIFAYCVLYNIAGDLKRNIAPSVGRRGENVDLQKETVEIFEIHCYAGITRGEGGGEKRVIFHVLAKYDGVVQQPLSSPAFLPSFLLFLPFLSFFPFFPPFFLSKKITGPECRTNENGLFVIISSRDARISLHFLPFW